MQRLKAALDCARPHYLIGLHRRGEALHLDPAEITILPMKLLVPRSSASSDALVRGYIASFVDGVTRSRSSEWLVRAERMIGW
jgi:hypothetical protein